MLKSQVYLLAGSETELKEEFLNHLKSRFSGNTSSSADYNLFYAQEPNQLSSALDAAYTYPLISAKRLIVIKNIEKLKEADKELLLKYMDNPPAASILILETGQDDLRGQFWARLSEKVEAHYFKPQEKKDAFNWILKEVKKQNKHISWPAAQLLEERVGTDLSTLKRAIEQLTVYAYERKEITKDDVALLCGKDYFNTTFDLLKAINQGSAEKAIEILGGLWTENKGGSEILGLLTWHFRRLLKVKKLENSHSFDQLKEALNIRSEYQLEMLIKESRRFTRERLEQIFNLLAQSDLSLRSHRNLERYILEFLLVKLCQKQKEALSFA